MVLRIEDTDVERSETRYEDQLIDDLKWMGIDWDEGPDSRVPMALTVSPIAWKSIESTPSDSSTKARPIFVSAAKKTCRETASLPWRASSAHLFRQVPQHRSRRRASVAATAGEACAIRLRIPERPIRFHDIVHGAVEFSSEVVSDPIILRSSGMPVYNYVVVIDDALMKITHVIRGDDHLSNTPKQVALYEALGWPVPEFAHLSTILGNDRERLSKRHGATSIANFRDMGVLPEALVNYLALSGMGSDRGQPRNFHCRRS